VGAINYMFMGRNQRYIPGGAIIDIFLEARSVIAPPTYIVDTINHHPQTNLTRKESSMNNELSLRYGCNPHQTPARLFIQKGDIPFQVINGSLGYINALDALNAWQLVQELDEAVQLPAAASFKHVSPSGAAVGVPLTEPLRRSYRVDDIELSPLTTAYARARGTDRLCSFGDWVALSRPVDLLTAKMLQREVSDGVIAPGYDPDALSLLRSKKNGGYVILEMHADYRPPEMEHREVFGITLEQKRNDLPLTPDLLKNIVTKNKSFSASAFRDALVALITLKYTQSNSVCLAVDGQVIGVGAGQQSRIHCTRLAAGKSEMWFLRQHPAVLTLKFKPGVRRPDKDNAIDLYLREDATDLEDRSLRDVLADRPPRLTAEEKRQWLNQMRDVVLGSDGYFPFRDSIDRGQRCGVQYVVQPGGSTRDEQIVQACNEYGMTMACTGVRLFHH
jgi:phosphoribosylaminoimidazolecarboxamide formyltransferase / IMP cyclohydrolase